MKRITTRQLSIAAGLSTSHFCRQFLRDTGQTPQQYVTERRVDAAVEMLRSTETPLARVALLVGFCNQAHMTTVFKRVLGSTPAQVRARE